MVTPLKKRRLANYKEDQELIGANESAEEMHLESSSETSPMKHVPNGLKKQILQNLVLEAVLDKAMEDMLSTPAATTTTNENNAAVELPVPVLVKKEDSKADHDDDHHDHVNPEVKTEDFKEENINSTTTKTTSPIKAPEPNSAFKSFFNSNVSLEALEAEIAATRKQREGSASSITSPQNNFVISRENNIATTDSIVNKQLSFNHPTMALAAASTTMETITTKLALEVKNEQSERVQVGDLLHASGQHINTLDLTSSAHASSILLEQQQNAVSKVAPSEVKKPSVIINNPEQHQQAIMPTSMPMELIANSFITKSEIAPISKLESWKMMENEKTEPIFLGHHHQNKNTEVFIKNEVHQPTSTTAPPISETKPKAKKRVSLADYKSLRKVNNSNNSSTCSTPVEATPPAPPLSSVAGTGCATSLPLPVMANKTSTTTTVIEQHPPAHPDLTTSSTNQDPGTPTQDEQQTTGSGQLPPAAAGSATADRKSSSLTSNSTAPTNPTSSTVVGSSTSLNNALPLFEKLDKLEMAQQELLKKKGIFIYFIYFLQPFFREIT